MTYLYLYIPGMAHEVQLSEPACHCFEKNAETERQSLAEYLAESVVTVTGRRWSYGDGHTYCTLDVEVRN